MLKFLMIAPALLIHVADSADSQMTPAVIGNQLGAYIAIADICHMPSGPDLQKQWDGFLHGAPAGKQDSVEAAKAAYQKSHDGTISRLGGNEDAGKICPVATAGDNGASFFDALKPVLQQMQDYEWKQ
jgi:hypothetical protein